MLLPWGRRIDICPTTGDDHAHRHHDRDFEQISHPNFERDPLHSYWYGFHHTHFYIDCHTDLNTHHFAHSILTSHSYLHRFSNLDQYAHPHALADIHLHTNLERDASAITHVYRLSDPDSYRYFYADSDTFPNTMSDILLFLKSLISVSGLSAYEGPVARVIEEKWKPLVDEISFSRLGSLQALKRGAGKGRHPSIMIAAHMDAIGLMVTQIVDGFLHVDDVGGVDARILPGTPVVVHGRQDLPGVVVLPPLKTLPEKARDEAIGLPHLLVDVGLLPSKVASLVRIGDLISFDTQPVELAGETLSGHSLDNRASVAALTVCLEELQAKSHTWDVWAVATAQEEETLGGAATSAFGLRPDLAIAVDVTFAKGPSANGWETFPLGKGPTLGWGANLHPFLYKKFKELAEKLEIPVAMDVVPAHSGTDAYAIQVAREGIPTMLLGIPLRYMHTPVEVVAIKDVQRVGRLLAEFINGLAPDFLSKIVWDEAPDEKQEPSS